MTEAQFDSMEAVAQLKGFTLSTGSQGMKYVVRFELASEQATPIARLFKSKSPLLLKWFPDDGSEREYVLGNVTTLRPSRLSTDPDGEVRFVAQFELPDEALSQSLGVFGVGIMNNPVEGPVGRLSIEQQQASMGF